MNSKPRREYRRKPISVRRKWSARMRWPAPQREGRYDELYRIMQRMWPKDSLLLWEQQL